MRLVTGAAAIVEGEPGIFPFPIARGMFRLNRWVRRRLDTQDDQTDSGETKPAPKPPSDPPDRPPV